MFKKEEGRFHVKSSEYFSNTQLTVLIDKETGVHYLHSWITSGGGGLTPLLDENGDVIINKNF
ncbi:DUF6440 family protein [Jeotgalibacillus proteolyticus]|uniref:DUF6440 domain-containing protein n=1 Tax=Jeotgalibacillus proteolyticus TaxID=2082395 RepID=A0A2S5GA73_9BACL|nr:DUF6440 family protein [Jeotgalibacillus proteolyticus]PPA69814.1 hypothetical protein C4B60_14885 [Jeotgalibacillus proteolyticus]